MDASPYIRSGGCVFLFGFSCLVFFVFLFLFCEEPKQMCNVSVEKNNVFGVVHITGLTGSMLSLKY